MNTSPETSQTNNSEGLHELANWLNELRDIWQANNCSLKEDQLEETISNIQEIGLLFLEHRPSQSFFRSFGPSGMNLGPHQLDHFTQMVIFVNSMRKLLAQSEMFENEGRSADAASARAMYKYIMSGEAAHYKFEPRGIPIEGWPEIDVLTTSLRHSY